MTDVCKFVTILYGITGYNGFQINLDVWKKMPKNIQQILQEEATAIAENMNTIVGGKLGDDDLAVFRKNGAEIYIVPKEERARWVEKLTPYKEEQIAKFGEFGQEMKKIADEANKRFPYTERGMY